MSETSKIYNFVYQESAPGRIDQAIENFLDELLGDEAPSRSEIKRLIQEGEISINGKSPKKAGAKINSGDEVSLNIPIRITELSPYDYPLDVQYEDDHIIVINKAAGISMHPGAGNYTETIANALVHHFGRVIEEGMRPGIVHRLDKDTTGLFVAAKTISAQSKLAEQFASKKAGRLYEALVFSTQRRPIAESGEIDAPIGRHPNKRILFTVAENGRSAKTAWKLINAYAYGSHIECKLFTGRTHQIRVHMCHIGHHVLGDPFYHAPTDAFPKNLEIILDRLGRQALHAKKLTFSHPVTKESMTFEAPPPEDFLELLSFLKNPK